MGGEREEITGDDCEVFNLIPRLSAPKQGIEGKEEKWFGDGDEALRLGFAGFEE